MQPVTIEGCILSMITDACRTHFQVLRGQGSVLKYSQIEDIYCSLSSKFQSATNFEIFPPKSHLGEWYILCSLFHKWCKELGHYLKEKKKKIDVEF
jgi:hypothetical protein